MPEERSGGLGKENRRAGFHGRAFPGPAVLSGEESPGVKVLFFAQCADWMNTREIDVPVEESVHLIDLIRKTPELLPLLDHLDMLKIAVNFEIADVHARVDDEDEIAFLPPLSGG
jgi:molybdopterin converting factor small subunit